MVDNVLIARCQQRSARHNSQGCGEDWEHPDDGQDFRRSSNGVDLYNSGHKNVCCWRLTQGLVDTTGEHLHKTLIPNLENSLRPTPHSCTA